METHRRDHSEYGRGSSRHSGRRSRRPGSLKKQPILLGFISKFFLTTTLFALIAEFLWLAGLSQDWKLEVHYHMMIPGAALMSVIIRMLQVGGGVFLLMLSKRAIYLLVGGLYLKGTFVVCQIYIWEPWQRTTNEAIITMWIIDIVVNLAVVVYTGYLVRKRILC